MSASAPILPPHNGAKCPGEVRYINAARAAFETLQIQRRKRHPSLAVQSWDDASEATHAAFVAIASNALAAFR